MRIEVVKRLGGRKGAAIEEAPKDWVKNKH